MKFQIWFSLLLIIAVAADAQHCPSEFWHYRSGFCYRFFNEGKTWQEAETFCNQFTATNDITGHLASIHDIEENAFISGLTAIGSGLATDDGTGPATWIGLHKVDNTNFAWSDHTHLDYTFWNPREPNSPTIEFCGITNTAGRRGHWDDQQCSNLRKFICKIQAPTPAPTISEMPFWTSYQGGIYRFYSDKTAWDDANDICNSQSARLVVIDTPDKNEFVSTLTASSATSAGPPTWIGLREEGNYKWSDGSAYTGSFDCIHTNDRKTRGAWNSQDCSSLLAFVCEKI